MRCGSVVVYLLAEPAENVTTARVGLVVGRAVGNSVVRHRVSRRLRAQLKDRLDLLPNGARLVVRALPDTAVASSAALGGDLGRALDKLTAGRPAPVSNGNPGRSGSSR